MVENSASNDWGQIADRCNPALAFAHSLTVAALGVAVAGWSGIGTRSWGLAPSIEEAGSTCRRTIADRCTRRFAFARSLTVAARGAGVVGGRGW